MKKQDENIQEGKSLDSFSRGQILYQLSYEGSPWDNVKCPNIQIIGVPEEDKKKGHEKMLEEIIVENFPKMGKEIITQVQEIQRVPKG